MKEKNVIEAVCPFRGINGQRIRLKIEPDGNEMALTWTLDSQEDAATGTKTEDKAETGSEPPAETEAVDAETLADAVDPDHAIWWKFKMLDMRTQMKRLHADNDAQHAARRVRRCMNDIGRPLSAKVLWLMCAGFSDQEIHARTKATPANIRNFRTAFQFGLFDKPQISDEK